MTSSLSPAPLSGADGPLTTVFVYGTLMPGERNAGVAGPEGSFVARPAVLPGHRLLHLTPEAYPAVLAGSPHEQVSGYALTYAPDAWTAALPFLDHLEGTEEQPPLYTREQVTLRLADGQTCAAWVYLYARTDRLAQPGVTPVVSGDWTDTPDRLRPRPTDR